MSQTQHYYDPKTGECHNLTEAEFRGFTKGSLLPSVTTIISQMKTGLDFQDPEYLEIVAAKGGDLHRFAQELAESFGQVVIEDQPDCKGAVQRWFSGWVSYPIHSERFLHNGHYAGTSDLECILNTKPKPLAMADFKFRGQSSQKAYFTDGVQLAAYRKLRKDAGLAVPEVCLSVIFDRESGKSPTVVEWPNDRLDGLEKAFCALYAVWKEKQNYALGGFTNV